MQKKEYVLVIQGYYGYGWEDLSSYNCGIRRVDYRKQSDLCRHDYKEYCISDNAPKRIISRYETIEQE